MSIERKSRFYLIINIYLFIVVYTAQHLFGKKVEFWQLNKFKTCFQLQPVGVHMQFATPHRWDKGRASCLIEVSDDEPGYQWADDLEYAFVTSDPAESCYRQARG